MPGEKILIVDDNPFNVKLAEYLLKAEGFDVRHVMAANEVIAAVASWTPSLVLMDLRLPGTDGLALTRLLRRDPANRALAIVAFSADSASNEMQNALDAGCNGYIAKPIDTDRLCAEIRRYL
jgi:CheY-like chemotaxis protein